MEEQTVTMGHLRTVDSFCQLLDRLIVARLKEWHYKRDNRHKEATLAREQADELSDAARDYLRECLDGEREPRVHQHLRYHEHASDKQVAKSLMDVVSRLVSYHAQYWDAQGRVLSLRKAEAPDYEEIHRWQLICDGANQQRSVLIETGDDLLRRMWEARKSA